MPSQSMPPYREAAVFFGIVLPLVIFGAVVGGAYYWMGTNRAAMNSKVEGYKALEINRRGMAALETQVSKSVSLLPKWEASLAKDTSSSFSANLLEVASKYSPAEFQQTTVEPNDVAAGLGAASAQPSSIMRLSTRGTFWATQRAMFQLETMMPQLQLQEMKIDPNLSSASSLNCQFTFTIWKK